MKIKVRKILNLIFFLAGVVCLQQGIAFSNSKVEFMGEHARVIEKNNIDPSALFYTEINQALAAEKKVRRQINN